MTDDDFLSCPFCGSAPWNEGDAAQWKDDNRYVQMKLVCCVTMSSAIGWKRARDMTVEQRAKEMKEALLNRWNTRHKEWSDE